MSYELIYGGKKAVLRGNRWGSLADSSGKLYSWPGPTPRARLSGVDMVLIWDTVQLHLNDLRLTLKTIQTEAS